MAIDPALIERIYEAAALPEFWPDVLGEIGRSCGAAGALFFTNSAAGSAWVASPGVSWIIEAYVAEGWMPDNERGAPMIAEMHPGFRTDADYRSADQRAALPVYRELLIPRGIDAAAGSVFQGARDDAIVLTVEHFASHRAARAALPMLNRLRPHLGRALSLASQLGRARAASAVTALGLAGVAAAVVSPDGRLRAANDLLGERLAGRADERLGRLRFRDRPLQTQVDEAVTALRDGGAARSIAVPTDGARPSCALHLLPLVRGGRDVFGWDGVLLLVAEPANASVPGADLLRLLFDLTPAEARLTRHLVEGRSLGEAAAALAVADATARVHLRRVFAKTGVRRQAELVRLLAGLGSPA